MKLHKLLITLAIGFFSFGTTFAATDTGPDVSDITMGVMQKDDPGEITHIIELPEQASDVARENVAKQHPENDKDNSDQSDDKSDSMDHNTAEAVKEAAHNAAEDVKEAAHEAEESSSDVEDAAHEAANNVKEAAQETMGEHRDIVK